MSAEIDQLLRSYLEYQALKLRDALKEGSQAGQKGVTTPEVRSPENSDAKSEAPREETPE